ncbi:DUF6029 family protein [Bacteroidia bacterium]|nr:DUF6029 family protein [Bacteroidia bacterium]
MKKLILILLSCFFLNTVNAQTEETKKWVLTGNFQSNTSFFDKDTLIGANTTVYKKQKSGNESWLFAKLNYGDWNFSMRYDLFNNSALLNPQASYTNQGLGFFQINKKVEGLDITAGYFYDQFASGTIFRAYEDRNIGIDYAVRGVRLKYNIANVVQLKAFTGQQKGNINNRFGTFPERIQGFNAEFDFRLGKKKGLSIQPGASLVNRTLDESTMSNAASEIQGYIPALRFNDPKYNTFAINAYATANYKGFTLYGEYSHKTKDMIRDLSGILNNVPGDVYLGILSYGKNRLGKKKQMSIGATVQYKKIDRFGFRINPYVSQLDGLLTYLPSITRANTFRLLARYTSVVQTLGEQAFNGDVIIGLSKKTKVNLNYSHVNSLGYNGDSSGNPIKLFREAIFSIHHKFSRKFNGKIGFQTIQYNQERYEIKPGVAIVETLTPFMEITWKYNRKESIRFECQVLETKQDLGSFINAVLEWNIAPKYSFSVSNMVNHKPERYKGSNIPKQVINYPTVFASYTQHASVYTLAYIKQVQGVNCTGGICRVEPAFSGVRFTITSNF